MDPKNQKYYSTNSTSETKQPKLRLIKTSTSIDVSKTAETAQRPRLKIGDALVSHLSSLVDHIEFQVETITKL